MIHVLRAKYFTSIKIIEGFERCGHHIHGPGDDGCTVSFEGIMQQSTATVLKEDFDLMRSMIPQMVAECRRTGRLSTEFLDGLNIPKDPKAVVRDDLTLCRQDSKLMTHEDSIASHLAIQREKANRENPMLQTMKKKEEESRKLLMKVERQRSPNNAMLRRRRQRVID